MWLSCGLGIPQKIAIEVSTGASSKLTHVAIGRISSHMNWEPLSILSIGQRSLQAPHHWVSPLDSLKHGSQLPSERASKRMREGKQGGSWTLSVTILEWHPIPLAAFYFFVKASSCSGSKDYTRAWLLEDRNDCKPSQYPLNTRFLIWTQLFLPRSEVIRT